MEVKNSLICLLRYFLDLKRSGILLVKGFPICFTGQLAWISSDYFKSLLLPKLLRGENDLEQSDEFQATGQYHLKMPRVYTNHPIKTALMCSNFIELMYNLHYYMYDNITIHNMVHKKAATSWKMLLL